jgi:hypothetical protein
MKQDQKAIAIYAAANDTCLSVIAFLGHVTSQSPHPLHLALMTHAFFLSTISLIAFGSGHVCMHILHPIHFSSSTTATTYITQSPPFIS